MQMDELTQQNAALVEEATAASQSLADQSRDLNHLMARYDIGAAEKARTEPATRAASTEARQGTRRGSRKSGTAKAAGASAGTTNTPVARKASGDDTEWQEF